MWIRRGCSDKSKKGGKQDQITENLSVDGHSTKESGRMAQFMSPRRKKKCVSTHELPMHRFPE